MPPHKKRKIAATETAVSTVRGTATKKDWLVGDLVVAKLRGHPPWPAQIENSEDYGYNPQLRRIFVKFFGSEEVGFCSWKEITPFTSTTAESLAVQSQRMNTNLEFKNAVEQIKVAFEEMKSGMNRPTTAQRTIHIKDSAMLSMFFTKHFSRRKRSSVGAMNRFTKAHGVNQRGLSQFFTGRPGRATEGSLKGGAEKPSRRPNVLGDYCYEEKENEQWYEKICEDLEKRIVQRKVETTIEALSKQISRTIPIRKLERISESQIVQDAKGRTLLVFLKNALQVPIPNDPAVQGLNALQAFIKVHTPPRPSRNDQRYVHREIPKGHGVHHLCFWPAIGRPAKDGVLSKHIIGVAGYKNNAVRKFLNEFTPVTQAVGALFEAVDQKNYERYNEHFHKVADGTTASFLRTTKRNCFLGMAIITGLHAGPHRDERDPDDGWVADLCFGDFEGGYLQVPQLGREFVLRPGGVVFIRSKLLQHSISKITSGLRFGVVYFTHKIMLPKPVPQ